MSRQVNFIFILFLFCVLPLHGQIVIDMEQDGGVYKVPCSVNGVKMKFIFDTGASAVSLSKSMATFMEDNGYLHQSDYLGKTQSQIADGSVVDVELVSLKDFEIGGLHLENVIATVKDGQNVPLLMGQTAIGKLGRLSIEGNRLIIHSFTTKMSAEEIEGLRREILTSFSNGSYALVIDKTEKLRNVTTLNDQDYNWYITALQKNRLFEKALKACKDWEALPVHGSDDYYLEENYLSYGDTYRLLKDPASALVPYQKALEYSVDDADDPSKGWVYLGIAKCYIDLNRAFDAEKYLKKGLSAQYAWKELSLSDVLAGRVSDALLGMLYYAYSLYELRFAKDQTQSDYYMKLSAKCGDEDAIDYCFKYNINYTK